MGLRKFPLVADLYYYNNLSQPRLIVIQTVTQYQNSISFRNYKLLATREILDNELTATVLPLREQKEVSLDT